jgi:hypothetical protein
MSYTRNFELDTTELELVENALRCELQRVQGIGGGQGAAAKNNTDDKAAALSELLGSLHNQKNWFRPKKKIYISG